MSFFGLVNVLGGGGGGGRGGVKSGFWAKKVDFGPRNHFFGHFFHGIAPKLCFFAKNRNTSINR